MLAARGRAILGEYSLITIDRDDGYVGRRRDPRCPGPYIEGHLCGPGDHVITPGLNPEGVSEPTVDRRWAIVCDACPPSIHRWPIPFARGWDVASGLPHPAANP